MVISERRNAIKNEILAGRRRCGTYEFRYLRLRAERARKKIRLFKIQQQKTISAAKNRIKKLCFGDFRGGARRVRPPLNSPVRVSNSLDPDQA